MSSKTFLAIDMGAGTLRVAEFEPTSEGVRLLRFGVKPLGLEGASERARPKALEKAANELFAEVGFQAKTGVVVHTLGHLAEQVDVVGEHQLLFHSNN